MQRSVYINQSDQMEASEWIVKSAEYCGADYKPFG